MDRMVKADGEASKAQTDATKAQKALRQLEMDVDALRQVSPCCCVHSLPCQAGSKSGCIFAAVCTVVTIVVHAPGALQEWEGLASGAWAGSGACERLCTSDN